MLVDPILEALIAAGAFTIAADRYEEETGDTELATLMRIPGLEWELVGGKPGLKFVANFVDGERWGWWDLACGTHDFGMVALAHKIEPRPKSHSSVMTVLRDAGFDTELTPRLYQLYREAVERACVL